MFFLSLDVCLSFLSIYSSTLTFPFSVYFCVCRPGGCAVQGSRFSSSTTLPDEVLNFVKTHPLMDETVPLLGHRPWVVKTMGRYIYWLSSHDSVLMQIYFKKTTTCILYRSDLHICLSRYQLTAMVVDTEAGPHKNRTVLFLGSTRGTILKFLMVPSGDSVSHSSVFLEEVEGFNPEKWVGVRTYFSLISCKLYILLCCSR